MIEMLLYFPDIPDPVNVTHLVQANSCTVSRRLYNDEFESVVDTCSVNVKYDQLLSARIMATAPHAKILCRIFDESSQPLFSGYIAPSLDVRKSRRVESLSIEIRDDSWKLDVPVHEDFQMPGSINDPEVTIREAYEAILLAAGYAPSDISNDGVVAAETVQMISVGAEKYTYRELLDSLLRDHGYVFSLTADGSFYLYRWNIDAPSPIGEIHDQISVVDTFKTEKQDDSYDGIKVSWAGLEKLENVRLYTANLPVGSDEASSGITILPDRYYPEDGDVIETFQRYQSEWLDIAYQGRKSRVKNDDITLVTTENHHLGVLADLGIAVQIQSFDRHKSRILLHNFTEEAKKLYVMEIYGRALFRSSVRETVLPAGAVEPREVSTEYVFSQTAAQRLANGLYRNQQFGNVQYTFSLRSRQYGVGDVVRIKQDDPAVDTTALITECSWTDGISRFRYKARALSSFGDLQAITTAYQAAKSGKGEKGEPGDDAVVLVVVSTNGNIFRPALTDTVLEARVYQGGEEITEQYEPTRFRWTRKSDDSTADDVWNSAYYSAGVKSIQITDEDVVKRATFFCELI
jgi:hypothetical protein